MEQENNYVSKKQLNFALFALIALVISLFGVLYIFLSNKIAQKSEIINDTDVFDEILNDDEQEEKYLVKEVDGKIGIYENGNLVRMLDIYVFTLPEKDQKLLKSGIIASTIEELESIISSYY